MLLGTYKPTLIGKNRLALPAKLRKEIVGKQIVLSVGFDNCIFGFGIKEWQQVTAVDLAKPLSDSDGRDIRRQLCAKAEVVELDVQGRFVVPENLAGKFNGNDDLILLGAGDHFEIWENKNWQAYQKKMA